MHDLHYIDDAQYQQAQNEPLHVKTDANEFGMHAEYVAEMTRQMVYEQFKEDAYSRGLNVFTTITKADQDAAYIALRRGVMDYEKKHGYRGPEGYMEIPAKKEEADDAIETELADHPDSDDIVAAVVLEASPKNVRAVLSSGDEINISGPGLAFAASLLSDKAPPNKRVHRGAIIRVFIDGQGAGRSRSCRKWKPLLSPPIARTARSARWSAASTYNQNKFNHVTQAWRQPGSTLQAVHLFGGAGKGLSPATIVNDAPISSSRRADRRPAWEPKNYDGKYEGPMTMRTAA